MTALMETWPLIMQALFLAMAIFTGIGLHTLFFTPKIINWPWLKRSKFSVNLAVLYMQRGSNYATCTMFDLLQAYGTSRDSLHRAKVEFMERLGEAVKSIPEEYADIFHTSAEQRMSETLLLIKRATKQGGEDVDI